MDSSSPSTSERGWRGSADLWLDAAYQMLIESGVDSVKVMPLAEKLGLSRTSFYWHFSDREALLAGLIARWESRNTANLIARAELPAATITEAVLHLCDCWIWPELFDSRLEFAIRTWALTDTTLAETLAQADATRIAAIKALLLIELLFWMHDGSVQFISCGGRQQKREQQVHLLLFFCVRRSPMKGRNVIFSFHAGVGIVIWSVKAVFEVVVHHV